MVLACALLAGCGGGDDKPAPQATEPPVTSDAVPLTIDEPVASQTLKATHIAGGRLQAPVDVKGQAEPGTTVRVGTGCHVSGCTATDKAAVDNQWAVHVVVKAPESHPSALVKVADAADASNIVFVEVRLHAKPHKLPSKPPQAAPQPTAPPSTGTPVPITPVPATPAPSGSPPKTFTMIGDSLAVGTSRYLPGLLPNFRVTTNAQTGRPLATGMQILGSARR